MPPCQNLWSPCRRAPPGIRSVIPRRPSVTAGYRTCASPLTHLRPGCSWGASAASPAQWVIKWLLAGVQQSAPCPRAFQTTTPSAAPCAGVGGWVLTPPDEQRCEKTSTRRCDNSSLACTTQQCTGSTTSPYSPGRRPPDMSTRQQAKAMVHPLTFPLRTQFPPSHPTQLSNCLPREPLHQSAVRGSRA